MRLLTSTLYCMWLHCLTIILITGVHIVLNEITHEYTVLDVDGTEIARLPLDVIVTPPGTRNI